MKTSTNNIAIRFTTHSDIKDVLGILFLNDNDMVKKELVNIMYKYTCRCAYDGIHGQAIGIIGYKIKTPQIEIIMLYAHPEYDVQAVKESLLEVLTLKFETEIKSKFKKLYFWVPEIELETQLFLKNNKFRAVRVVDDEYLMERIA